MLKVLLVSELLESVKNQELQVMESRPATSKKQALSDYNNICNMLDYAKQILNGVNTITIEFDNYINVGDVLKAVYLKQLHPNSKDIIIKRCESVEVYNRAVTKILTCCKSRACKIKNDGAIVDYVKYIVFTSTVKAIITIEFEKVVNIEKVSVGYLVKNAKSVKPLF